MCRYPHTYLISDNPSADGDLSASNHFCKRLPVLIKQRLDGSIVGHAHNMNEIRTIFTDRDRSSLELHGYLDELPHALVSEDVYLRLVQGVGRKEQQARGNINVSAIECVVMKDGIDVYMSTLRGKTPNQLAKDITNTSNPLHEFHNFYEPRSRGAQAKPHYDVDKARTHERRLLLFAECQIGKTGAYLEYIRLLRHAVNRVPKFAPESCLEDGRSWDFPYWLNLCNETRLDYSQPKEGDYHIKLTINRVNFLRNIAASTNSSRIGKWLDEYCNWLRSPKGELIVSQAGRKRIAELKEALTGKDIPFDAKGRPKADAYRCLTSAVNWDKRMSATVKELPEKLELPSVLSEATFERPKDVSELQGRSLKELPTKPMRASQAPPAITDLTSDDAHSCKTFTLVLKPRKHGESELFGGTECTIYVPKKMESMLCCTNDTVTAARLRVRWIFTCSYKRADKKSLLNRESAMSPLHPHEYAQVLIVRGDPTEVELYRRRWCEWAQQYIVVAMPNSMTVRYKDGESIELLADVCRIGFARLFSQLLASQLGLDEIWMLDDNVELCWVIGNTSDTSEQQIAECSFGHVMLGMEMLFDRSAANSFQESLPEGTKAVEFVSFDAGKAEIGGQPARPLKNENGPIKGNDANLAGTGEVTKLWRMLEPSKHMEFSACNA